MSVAYIHVYSEISQVISPCGKIGSIVNFDQCNIVNNMRFIPTSDSIMLYIEGDYEANYIINSSPRSGITNGVVSFKLLKNDDTIPGSKYFTCFKKGTPSLLIGHVKFKAKMGDIIKLASNSLSSLMLPSMSEPSINIGLQYGRATYNNKTIISDKLTFANNSSIYVSFSYISNDNSVISTVSDNSNNTYIQAVQSGTPNSYRTEIWYTDIETGFNGIITGTFSNLVQATMKIINVLGTDIPSLGAVSVSNGTTSESSEITSNIITTNPGSLGLMCVCLQNLNGSQTTNVIYPNIERKQIGLPGIIGLNISQFFTGSGLHKLTMTTNQPNEIWVLSTVEILTFNKYNVCEVTENASLDIKLLK